MKSVFGGSALLVAVVVSGLMLLAAKPSLAETLLSQFQQTNSDATRPRRVEGNALTISSDLGAAGLDGASSGILVGKVVEAEKTETIAAPAADYVATAYSLRGRTASGIYVNKGIIAADPRFLPLGSRVRLEAGGYSGEYLVADTGGAVKGRHIDIWIPTSREAMRFGRRTVKLTVLSFPKRKSATRKRTVA
jgi:3D (Asp-Asp-Asp) domain-containing protein